MADLDLDSEQTRSPIRLLLADDHWVVRQGLSLFLARDPEFEVIGEAEDGEAAVRLACKLRPDVVLMDLLMPRLDGVAATAAIHRDAPDVEVLVLTTVLDDDKIVAAIRAGAIGYLVKDMRGEELKEAIRAAAAGRVHLSPQAAEKLMRELRVPATTEALTDREKEVLRLVALGYANKEIAVRLGIGSGTVKTHVSNVLGKLGAQSRTQAALHAVRIGLVTAEEVASA
jgi:NarL family two-component system response regulator LiaR